MFIQSRNVVKAKAPLLMVLPIAIGVYVHWPHVEKSCHIVYSYTKLFSVYITAGSTPVQTVVKSYFQRLHCRLRIVLSSGSKGPVSL